MYSLPKYTNTHIKHIHMHSEDSGSLILALILGELTAPPRYALTIVVAPTLAEKVLSVCMYLESESWSDVLG